MSKKEFFLVKLAIVLGVIYAVFYTNVFRSKPIHIEHTVRSLREAWNSNGRRVDATGRDPNGVTFSLNQDCRLKSVKVVPLAEWQTNRNAAPVWELISPAGSPPVNSFGYGLPIPGMAPSQSGARAKSLEPGVEYRLLVKAGSAKGEHDFTVGESSAAHRNE
jgi:hypothetical protein